MHDRQRPSFLCISCTNIYIYRERFLYSTAEHNELEDCPVVCRIVLNHETMMSCHREAGNNSNSRQQWMLLRCLFILLITANVNSFSPDVSLQHRREWSFSGRVRSHLFGTATTEELLREHGFGQRLRTLTASDLPVAAELHDHGAWKLCRIVQLEPPSKAGSLSPPRLLIQTHEETRVVDLGQITTIWHSKGPRQVQNFESHLDSFATERVEHAMQQLYHNFSGRSSSSKGGMTKKTVSKIVKQVKGGPDREYAEDVLRKMLKAGEGMVRLVDSALAMDYLYEEDYPTTDIDSAFRQAVGGCAIAQDASLGGRFKRMPCIFVSSEQSEDIARVDSITFVNGGWLVVDSNVRSGAEARKFAQRTFDGSDGILTAADERIAHRLECLAMGEVFGTVTNESELEVDVRESLKALDLPMTSDGAREALVRIGRWSQGRVAGKLEPWSRETLYAAKEYTQADATRRKILARIYDQSSEVDLDGRVDLTSLPAVCIDAKNTNFRDDAIGVRPRSGTGRKVVAEASNWEVLIHIADVSDVYSPEQQFLAGSTVDLLRAAAVSRGMSRYDLPLGPLHLLPPVVLKSLGLVTDSPESAISAKIPNRCLTLWAYIDERDGKVIDAGLERTLISTPLALTYESASMCLDQRETLEKNHPLSKVSAVLALAERNLQLWSNQYKQSSEAARKREDRLSAKEIVTQNRKQVFLRTRGHRLVDMGLDLYGVSISQLLRNKKAPVPRASGSGSDRMGRVATAPLRRYVDGMAQRQALSVLCNYGGPPLTVDECQHVNAQTNDAMDRLANLRPLKQKGEGQQQLALAKLVRKRNRVVQAMSTGRGNEVSVDGAVGKCQGIQGRLPVGQIMSVRVHTVHVEKGILIVELIK